MNALRLIIILFVLLSFRISSSAQCGNSFLKVIGQGNEIGFTIAYSAKENVLYACGTMHDSIMIVRLGLDFQIDWIHKIDVIQNEPEYINGMIVDQDGKIAIGGTIATVNDPGYAFLCRYDPESNTMLWAEEIRGALDGNTSALIELPNTNQYLLSYNPNSPNNAELHLIDKSTGNLQAQFSKEYNLGSSETISDMVLYNGTLYGTGRFTDGGSTSEMRSTLLSMNPLNGNLNYALVGHKPAIVSARLYSFDLVIDQDMIYYVSCGNESSSSISNTKVYIQKATLDGEIQWLKEYDLPGNNDWVNEIVKTGNGFAILGTNRTSPSDIIVFKINTDGDVVWGRLFDIDQNDNTISVGGVSGQMVAVNDKIYFNAFSENSGSFRMVLGALSTDGALNESCDFVQEVNIPTRIIPNPTYYFADIDVDDLNPQFIQHDLQPSVEISQQVENACASGGVESQIDTTICSGSSFEGYNQTGIYEDLFLAMNGCDSVRQLTLRVVDCKELIWYNLNACASFMNDGSHMDYSEFDPEYVNPISCGQLSATNVFRDPPTEKHSCTPGVGNSIAMCISASPSCTYLPGNSAALLFDITITPASDSVVQLSGVEFFEKAPATYSWISGPGGPNNYPKFYGIRVLKNNVEIFRQTDISTSQSWSLQSFDFISLEEFRITAPAVIRFELFPYCPIGNGAQVSAWDIDEIKVSGGCWPAHITQPGISGVVSTTDGRKIRNAEMALSSFIGFSNKTYAASNEHGEYQFEKLIEGNAYFIKGKKNDDLLNGVNTFDLLKIQKHLLGIEPFTQSQQWIAADVNRNGNVNVLDILELRKTILGINTSFPNNTSWRLGKFGEQNKWSETQRVETGGDQGSIDWTGIKIGDLNNDVIVNVTDSPLHTRSGGLFSLAYEDEIVEAGTDVTISFKCMSVAQLEGMQFMMKVEDAEIVSVQSNVLDVSHENYNIDQEGLIRFSWSQAKNVSLNPQDELLSITLTVHKDRRIKDIIALVDRQLRAEAYLDNEIQKLEFKNLEDDNDVSNIDEIHIYPNPFRESTQIELSMQQEGKVQFAFYDFSGQIIYSFENVFPDGKQQIEIGQKELGYRSGIITCQVICKTQVITEKLVMMN